MVSLRRKILYSVFILIFLIVTPLTWMYAAGYKIGSGFSVQKTGILVIETEPSGGKIILNDKPIYGFFDVFNRDNYKRTPARISNLLPGEYDVRVEMDGYWPWQKKLSIKSSETTFAEDIKLFRKEMPLPLSNDLHDELFLSPDMRYLAGIDRDGFELIDTDDEVSRKITTASSTDKISVSWSDSQYLAINGFLVRKDMTETPLSLQSVVGKNADNFKLDLNGDQDQIYYSLEGAIYQFDRKSALPIQLYKGSASDYIISSDILYVLSDNSLTVVAVNDLADTNKISLPESRYALRNMDYNLLIIEDTKNQSLLIIDPETTPRPIRDVIQGAKDMDWINKSEIIYANDFEILSYNLENKQKKLITRISKEVKDIIWHPNNSHVIFSTDNTLNIVELDDREKYNITKLAELTEIRSAVLSESGNTLYFLAKIGNIGGVYKLDIN